jgi:hypothetical protein
MEPFGIAVIVVAIVAGIAAIASYIGSGNIYKTIGKGQFALDHDEQAPGPKPGSAAAIAEQVEEVRQMIQARSDRREARGESPLDVDAEVEALLHPHAAGDDAELREEVRQLVIARNERRLRHGEESLDVEAEVERRMRDLGP